MDTMVCRITSKNTSVRRENSLRGFGSRASSLSTLCEPLPWQLGRQFGKLYRHDARATQPLYGRVVLESK
jgi:hypothetical protein